MRFSSLGASSESAIAAMMAGSIQRWCKCAMTMTPSTVANDERRRPKEVPEPVYLLPVRDRGANAAEEGADFEVPDDGTVGDAREEELQERDGNKEPTADNDGEDADDEAAHEEQRRLARKQPGRERANPREIHHGSPASNSVMTITRCRRSSSSHCRRYSAHCHVGLGALKNLSDSQGETPNSFSISA